MIVVDVEVEIKNRNDVASAVLDSASTVSTLSREFVHRHGVKYEKVNLAVSTVAGSQNVIGISNPLIVRLFGHYECKISLYVIESKYDMFLGANFIKALNIRVGYELNKTVVFVNQDKWLQNENYRNSFEFVEPKLDDQEIYLSELNSKSDEEDEFEKEFDIEFVPTVLTHETISSVLKQNNEFSDGMKKLIPLIESVTAKSYKDLKKCDLGEHTIELIDQSPVFVPPYRMSETERKLIREEVKLLLEAGFIRKSS